ncbi:MAG: outer membrane lipoprotein chaperone LolA [Burkholderiales bacterium]|jgi:outer membrane lipoprotein carrier protein|nr:outer membrane lipoprotein chaperone LolA [Burkholderiales bacterium]
MIRAVACFALAALSGLANAGGIDELHAFLEGAKNGRATFRQIVTGSNARGEQVSTGIFAFARPGKFRWAYEKPWEQLVVGDGTRVWVYDKDLNQVIVRELDAALGATPAALLAGDNALERHFALVDGGEADALAWVVATPKSAESTFTKVRIGFRDKLPRAMVLVDAFGQTTRLAFDRFERNVAIPAGEFRFVPPAGADVVSAPR